MHHKNKKTACESSRFFKEGALRYELDFLILKNPFRQGKHSKSYLPVRQAVFNKV